MLIIFSANNFDLLRSHLSSSDDGVSVVVAQSGVYELANIIQEFPAAKLFVLQRDLEASGLLSRYKQSHTQNHTKNANLTLIDFEQFVRLTTQHSPCITVQ
jgi:sulfur transfer complex TusBCD TusB component (DsrH family)